MSPRKKKPKTSNQPENLKRKHEDEESSSKRIQTEKTAEDLVKAQQRKNFIKACEQVSCQAYFDHKSRLLLIYLPPCVKDGCKHPDKNGELKEIASRAQEAFQIDIRSNMWFEALEDCILFISPTQYLPAHILKGVVEIMLNAHDDEDAECSISDLIMKCQCVLMNNFGTHPPCFIKPLRQCYKNFLTSPLDAKDNTFTNRNQYGHDKGIVKYCMNRLEYELSSESKDECLVDKLENTPQEMKQSIKGVAWQNEKLEIYEVLERKDRIDRLMAVLGSIIELLQFDLAIWQQRYTTNLGTQILRSHWPLMTHILWPNNTMYMAAVNNNCRQILKIFVQMVHLQFPERHLYTIILWLNAMVQTFYICESNSNSDYPNTGKYCMAFAKEFYKIISGMPHDSIVRILDVIKPAYMKHLIGVIHLKSLLSTEEDCIIKNLISFINKSQWNTFPDASCEIQISEEIFPKPATLKRTIRYLMSKLEEWGKECENEDQDSECYAKMEAELEICEPNLNHVVHTLFATLDAYLDAYSIGDVQETLDSLNEKLLQDEESNVTINEVLPQINSYTVTEHFIKKYRFIYQSMKKLVLLLQKLKQINAVPGVLKVFKKIDLLDL